MVRSVLASQRGGKQPTRTNPPSTRRIWIIALVLLALFASGLGFVVANERQANTQTDRAHASWHVTRRQIASALAELTRVRGRIRADRRTTTVVVSALDQDTTQLTGVRAELQQAQSSMVAQGSTIVDLQDCLGGVEQALNALSVGDLAQALGHLSAVATPCEKVPVGG